MAKYVAGFMINMPFDGKRMIFRGFKTMVSVGGKNGK